MTAQEWDEKNSELDDWGDCVACQGAGAIDISLNGSLYQDCPECDGHGRRSYR